MKKTIPFFIIFITIFSSTMYAHSGKTDDNGGHYDTSTGEYHYHHGYSAHQHTNGECPYEMPNSDEKDTNTEIQTNSEDTTKINGLENETESLKRQIIAK